jgi:hypothetical protein
MNPILVGTASWPDATLIPCCRFDPRGRATGGSSNCCPGRILRRATVEPGAALWSDGGTAVQGFAQIGWDAVRGDFGDRPAQFARWNAITSRAL